MKKNSFITGVLASIAVFGGGYFVSKPIWKYVDKGYVHGLGLSHLFLLLLFLFCIFWFAVGVAKRKDKKLVSFWLGSAYMNFIFITVPIIYLFNDFNKDSNINKDFPSQSITIMKDTLNNGAVILNQDGDTLVYRKGDTNLIDRTEQLDYKTMEIKKDTNK